MTLSLSSELPISKESTDTGNKCPECVRVVLLSNDLKLVVMVLDDGVWDLPYFEYPKKITSGARIQRVCSDFRRWLAISSSEVTVTALVELLGHLVLRSKRDKAQLGQGKLIVMELHFDACVKDIELPPGAEWKDASFLRTLQQALDEQCVLRRIFQVLLTYMPLSSSLIWPSRTQPSSRKTTNKTFLSLTGNSLVSHIHSATSIA